MNPSTPSRVSHGRDTVDPSTPSRPKSPYAPRTPMSVGRSESEYAATSTYGEVYAAQAEIWGTRVTTEDTVNSFERFITEFTTPGMDEPYYIVRLREFNSPLRTVLHLSWM